MHTLLSKYVTAASRSLRQFMAVLVCATVALPAVAQLPRSFENQPCYTTAKFIFQQLNDETRKSSYYQWRKGFKPDTTHQYTRDTFDEVNYRYRTDEATETTPYVQATHTYVDTVYVRKGSEVRLDLGNIMYGINSKRYVRWYSYRTQRGLRINNGGRIIDLLRPVDYSRKTAKYYCDPDVGYVQWSGLDIGHALMWFYYPTDEEYAEWGLANDGHATLPLNNRWYVIACDVSSDETSGIFPSGASGTLQEPVLTNRYIFYISGIDAEGKDLEDSSADAGGYRENPYWNYIRTTKDVNRSQPDLARKHYYENLDIDFPYVRFDESASKEMVALTKNATHIYVPGEAGKPNKDAYVDVYLDPGNSGIRLINPASFEAGNLYNTFNGSKVDDGKDGVDVIERDGRQWYHLKMSMYALRDVSGWGSTYDSNNVLFNVPTQARGITFAYPHTDADHTQRTNAPDDTATIYVVSPMGDGLTRYRLTFKDGYRLLTQSEVAAIDAGEPNEALGINKADIEKYSVRTPSYLAKNYQYITQLNFDYDPSAEDIPAVQASRRNKEGAYPFPLSWNYSSYGFASGATSVQANTAYDFAQWGSYSILHDYTAFDKRSNGLALPNGHAITDPDRGYFLYIDAAAQPGLVAQLPFRDALCAGSQMYATAWVKNAHNGQHGVDAALLMSVVVSIEDDQGRELESYVVARQSTSMIGRTSRSKRYGGTGRRGDDFTGGREEWMQTYFSFVLHEPTFTTELKPGYHKVYYLRLENNATSSNGADYYIDDIKLYVKKPQVDVTQVGPSCSTQSVRYQVKMNYDRAISRFGLDDVADDASATLPLSFVVVDSVKWVEGYAKIDAQVDEQLRKLIASCSVNFALVEGSDGLGHNAFAPVQCLNLYNSFHRMEQRFAYDPDRLGYNPVGASDDGSDDKWWRVLDTEALEGRYLVADVLVGDDKTSLVPGRKYILIADDGKEMQSSSFSPHDLCAYKGSFIPRGSYYILTAGETMTDGSEYCAGQVNSFTGEIMAYDNGKPIHLPEGRFDWYMGTLDEYHAPNATGLSPYEAVSRLREVYPTPELLLDTIKPKGQLTAEMIAYIDTLTNTVRPGYNNPMLVLGKRSVNLLMLDNLKIVLDPIDLSIPDSVTNDLKYLVCFEPVEVPFKVTGTAPRLSFGYNDETYADDAQAGLRIGLTQLAGYRTDEMTLPLRSVSYASESGVDHLGLITSRTTDDGYTEGVRLDELYLISTDDPQYQIDTGDGQDGQFLNPVGTVKSLYAVMGQGGQVTLRFAEGFQPREGFTYQLKVWYQEMNGDSPAHGEEGSATCYGSAMLPVKIVPLYGRWTGSATVNWNNDAYWKRSYRRELCAERNDSFALYDYHEPQGSEALQHQGFVPMRFTCVTLPEASQTWLYEPKRTGRLLALTEGDTQRPETMGRPTRGIEYDLMALDTQGADRYNVEPYYANTAAQLHLEPRAELLHSELASYRRAWVEMKWKAGEWQLAATPLSHTYAGELFAPKEDGWQRTQYFRPITFAPGDYDRFSPAVYQRGWSQAKALRLDNPGGEVTDMALTGEWTGVYNRADEDFGYGTGFSIKPVAGRGQTLRNDSILVRLPKQDASYSYYAEGSTAGSQSVAVTTDGGRLYPFGKPLDAVQTSPQGKAGYYLVGNPFACHLDLTAFFQANPALEPTKYWTLNGAHTAPLDLMEHASDATALIAPGESFFVKLRESATLPEAWRFTPDMQALLSVATTQAEAPRALTLTADEAGRRSTAVIEINDHANSAFDEGEDVEALWADSESPLVYTVAGRQAAAVNLTDGFTALPIGVWGKEGTSIDVTFAGLDAVAAGGVSLYDAVTGQCEEITEGQTRPLVANAHGRYFLQAVPAVADEAAGELAIYAVNGTLVVASPAEPLTHVALYRADGRMAAPEQADLGERTHTYLLPTGVYIVKAQTATHQAVVKVAVAR